MSSPITVRRVSTRADLKRFVQLPRRLYKGLAGFTAPLDFERGQLFGRKTNPFFSHGDAAYWVAFMGEEPVGRVSAQIDDLHEVWGAPEVGMFGAFDTIDDPEVSAALLSQALAWLRDKGKQIVRGPFNLSISWESGLMVDGFEEPAMLLMPWHPPYLAHHVERQGFIPARELQSFLIDRATAPQQRMQSLVKSARLPDRFTQRPLSQKDGLKEFLQLAEIYNAAWQTNWGFVPLTEDDVRGMYGTMRWFINKDSGVIIEEDGRPIAFSISIGNIMDYVHDFDGQLSPVNIFKFARRALRHEFDSVRNVLMGVLPEYQGGALGAALALSLLKNYVTLMDQYKANRLEFGWIEEGNKRTLDIVRYFGGVPNRRFCVYERETGL